MMLRQDRSQYMPIRASRPQTKSSPESRNEFIDGRAFRHKVMCEGERVPPPLESRTISERIAIPCDDGMSMEVTAIRPPQSDATTGQMRLTKSHY
jgi:hypothetical protein